MTKRNLDLVDATISEKLLSFSLETTCKYPEFLFDTTILRQLKQFVGKNNLTTQARAIYWLYMGFQDQPEILLNTAINTVISNQLGKITNTQFEELQTQITQVILEKEVQKIIQEGELKELDFDGA
ncbi:hypothetical protein G9A89_021651 [Geosiphon pyriformis]|nr:hypothetical protein G9A89_021651 [Geosiphon pyriformis]